MSYSSFTNLELKAKFGVEQIMRVGLFKKVKPRPVSELLKNYLEENYDFGLMQGSEKARSEYIIAPVFAELRNQSKEQISVFSGIEFNVDAKQKLTGKCDFLVSRSPYQSALEAPVVVAVEAKRQDFEKGYNQCVAEMIAALIYNERRGQHLTEIYGCVTTGDVWRFLILKEKLAEIDSTAFSLNNDLEKILGILWACALGKL
jgi:hypothetical protein